MCPHIDFEILYYKDGIMVARTAKQSRSIWVDIDEVKSAINPVS